MKLGIIGGGKVGCCFGEHLHENLIGITASTAEKCQQLALHFQKPCFTNETLVKNADIILLTVPDRKIASLAKEIAAFPVAGKVFLHCSGSLGLEALYPLEKSGAKIGSLHPLQSFAGGKTKLDGVYMALDGCEEAREAGSQIAVLLGGKIFFVPAGERAAYHAAACLCSNYAVTVEALAQKLMSRWTGDDAAAWMALLPLFNGTAENLRRTQNPGSVLTGPIARGDCSTVAKHLQVLPPEILSIYCSLGRETTRLALANGTIDTKTAQQLQELLALTQNSEE